MADHLHEGHEPRSGGPGRWVFWGFLAVAAYFLLMEHRAHAVQYLPYVLLLACPLMHLFHGHHGHGGKSGDEKDRPAAGEKEKHGCH
jgi:hypothetical protein